MGPSLVLGPQSDDLAKEVPAPAPSGTQGGWAGLGVKKMALNNRTHGVHGSRTMVFVQKRELLFSLGYSKKPCMLQKRHCGLLLRAPYLTHTHAHCCQVVKTQTKKLTWGGFQLFTL